MLALSVILHCHTSWAEFFGVYSGINQIQHQYLIDTADDKEQTYGASLDMQAYRKQPTGWMARGPKARAQQSTNHIDLDVHASLYQFHTHQGVWLEFEWQKNTLETVIGSNQIYIDESGLAQSLTSGDTVLLERQFLRGQAYWYESIKDEGPLNIIGLFYSEETSPVSATISSTNATVFDGRFTGFGFSLGRIKDDRGLNFQWRLNLAQLDTDFSNDATLHRALSSLESTVYQLDLKLDWHYRYYLAPYWYLVPSIHYQYQSIFQSQFQPEFVEHEKLNFTQFSGFIAIRHYF